MPRLALLAVLALILAACGRGDVTSLGLGGAADGGAGARDVGPGPGDGGPWPEDVGPGPRDAEPSDREPPPPPIDAGQCTQDIECRRFGEPDICPDGRPGRWRCNAGVCETQCITCNTDCDCPWDLACANGLCAAINRPNSCCLSPFCPPGTSCVYPDGSGGVCPDEPPPPFDAGVEDGGPVPPDGGPVPPDGGPPPPLDAGVPDAGPPVTPVGAACMDNGQDCGPIGFCIPDQQGFPDGYCSQGCGAVGAMCPSGAECLSFGPGQQLCLDNCANNADCRAGYGCVQLGLANSRVCWPLDPGSSNPNGAAVGGACQVDNDCQSALTCLNMQGWPGGYCTRTYCDPQNNPCPSSSSCYAFPGLYSLCMADCPSGGSQSTCRNGYYCLGPTGAQGACFPN